MYAYNKAVLTLHKPKLSACLCDVFHDYASKQKHVQVQVEYELLADPKRLTETCGYHYSQDCNVCNRETDNITERSGVDEWRVAAGGEGKLSRRI